MSENISLKEHLYSEIARIIRDARQTVSRSVNSAMVATYWQVGRLIVEDEQQGKAKAEYGKAVLKSLSVRLSAEFGKGFDASNLRYMRLFYQRFQNCDALRHNLSWTHYRHLLKVESEEARRWYLNAAIEENWSTRALERQINSFYYERLLSSKNPAPVQQEAREKTAELKPLDVLKDPYVLEFLQLQNPSSFTEDELETALITDLQKFMLELGAGFAFVARQKHFDLDGEHFYIDLVFYNFKLKCFVLLDLKRGKLTHQDVGRMDTYIRLYEEFERGEEDNPTIGLILCSDKNEAVAQYSMLADHEQLFASKYQLVLPKVDELETMLTEDIKHLREQGLKGGLGGE